MRRNLIQVVSIVCFIVLSALGPIGAQESGEPPTRDIINVTGDLYRGQNNQHYNVILVTDEGIIISDPIDSSFAAWLKEELKARFDQPVKYVLYSHHHWDHIGGGDVFADTATIISHENTPANLEQASDNSRYADVRGPDVLYSDNHTISLGGKTVEMRYTGKNHSDDMSVLYFPDEKAVFVVDFINVGRLPWRTMPGHYPDWIDSIKEVETMDIEYLVPGHGRVGVKRDITEHREYMEELIAAVSDGIAQGKSVEELQESITMDAYKHWGQYGAWRAENVSGTYERLTQPND